MPSGMPFCKVYKGEKGSKISKMINMVSTGIRISDRLGLNIYIYGLFDKFALAVVGSCEVAKKPQTFLNRTNQHVQ